MYLEKKMKKTLVVLTVLAVLKMVNATVLVQDNFDYPNGSLTANTAWTDHSGTTGQMQVVGGQVSIVDGESEDVNTQFNEVASGALYAGFDVRITDAGTDEYFFHFKPSSGYYYRSRLFAIADGTGYKFAIGYNSGDPQYATFTNTVFALNETYRVVVGVDFDNEESTLSVVGIESGLSATYTYGVDPMNAVAFRQSGGTGDALVDNLIVADNYAEAVPEPMTVALLGLGGLLVNSRRRK
ncbi:MAG: PEP-CTERM sorting domain-containing protein [Candidatus Marinimicrobia bacterium]|nr:PEP-CTERM sorting domain-containing protein [Candidatus Neomarinimicrobiota bacterium]